MNNIVKVGKRNHIETLGRRYSLGSLISESYQTLYDCPVDSKIYKLTESHIADIQRHPKDISRLSKNLEILKGLVKLGESAKIKESDIPDAEEIEDETLVTEDEEFEEETPIEEDDDIEDEDFEDPLEEDDELEYEDLEEDDDLITEEDPTLEEDEDITSEEEEVLEEDDDDEEITPEELSELKKHLKEIRKARRTRESEEVPEEEEVIEENEDEDETDEPVAESRSWKSEKASMTRALKNFRESSNKKAFYKSFKKLHECMKSGRRLTLEESILLYKASNSAMTHLTVELEHNPEFIYTFRECAGMLSRDNAKLLECIRKQVAPSKSLVESYRNFSKILLESDDLEDEIVEEDEEVLLHDEEKELNEISPLAAAAATAGIGMISKVKSASLGKDGLSVSFKDSEEVPEDEEVIEENEEEEIPAPSEEIVEEDEDITPEEEEVIEENDDAEEEVVKENDEDLEEDDDLDDEITDEEAEALKNKLMEIRKSRKK